MSGPSCECGNQPHPGIEQEIEIMAKIEDIAPRRAGRWLDADDRALVIGCPMNITSIGEEKHAAFGPRWVVEGALLATGETVLIGLGAMTKAKDGTEVDNAGRRHVLEAVAATLLAGDAVDPVVLFRDGSGPAAPWVFRSATEDEIAEPAAPDFPVEVEAPADGKPIAIAGERLAKAGRR
jgi:hypothetical protein